MIKIENIYTGNWEAAIRGMRNPMNSWNNSDSWFYDEYEDGWYNINGKYNYDLVPDHPRKQFIIGDNDLELALKLATAGADHGKFLRQVIFSCDVTAPLYWWKEMDTYKVGTVRNSCSTMHKITSKPFELDDFSHEHLDSFSIKMLEDIIRRLNANRNEHICWDPKDNTAADKKDYWWQLIQLLPSSYNQRATWTANYEVLRNIYFARRNHKLDEWHEFCKMIEKLPYHELITELR